MRDESLGLIRRFQTELAIYQRGLHAIGQPGHCRRRGSFISGIHEERWITAWNSGEAGTWTKWYHVVHPRGCPALLRERSPFQIILLHHHLPTAGRWRRTAQGAWTWATERRGPVCWFFDAIKWPPDWNNPAGAWVELLADRRIHRIYWCRKEWSCKNSYRACLHLPVFVSMDLFQ